MERPVHGDNGRGSENMLKGNSPLFCSVRDAGSGKGGGEVRSGLSPVVCPAALPEDGKTDRG